MQFISFNCFGVHHPVTTPVCFSILLWMGIWVVASFQVLLQFLYKSLCDMFSFLLGKDPGVELLSHRLGVYLTL